MENIDYNKLRYMIISYRATKNKILLEEIIHMHSSYINELLLSSKYKELEKDEKLSCIVLAIIEIINFFDIQLEFDKYKQSLRHTSKKILYNEIKKIKIDSNFESYDYYVSQHKNGEENSFIKDYFLNLLEKEKIKRILDILPQNQKQIIISKFGLFGNDILTSEEIAFLLDCSKEYVEQIELSAKNNIKKFYKKYTEKN